MDSGATCPECGQLIALKPDGTYYRHMKINYTCPTLGTVPKK